MSNPAEHTPNQPKSTAGKERLWTLSFLFVVIISFLANVNGNGVHNGVTILVDNAGGSATYSGLIIAAFSFTALVARFFAGAISDKQGRRAAMFVGFGILIVGCAAGLITNDLASLMPVRILMGFGFSVACTASAAAVADIVPANRLGEGMGYQGLAFALGMAGGPSLAIALADMGRAQLFGCMLAFVIIGLVLTFFLKLKKPQDVVSSSGSKNSVDQATADMIAQRDARLTANRPKIADSVLFRYIEYNALRPAIVTMLAYLPMSLYLGFMGLYAQAQHIEGVHWYFAIATVVMIAVRVFAGKLFDRCAINTLLLPSLAVGFLGLLLPLLLNNFAALAISGACYGIYCGVVQPLLTTEAMRRSPSTRRGATSAMFYIGIDVGIISGSALWGFTVDNFGFSVTFILALVLVAIAALAAIILLRESHSATK